MFNHRTISRTSSRTVHLLASLAVATALGCGGSGAGGSETQSDANTSASEGTGGTVSTNTAGTTAPDSGVDEDSGMQTGGDTGPAAGCDEDWPERIKGATQLSQPQFSVPHGIYETPFELIITATDPGALLYYTLDGSVPTAANGTMAVSPASIQIDTTAVVRAIAVGDGGEDSHPRTQTYIFLDGVLAQSATQPGYPQPVIGGEKLQLDYEMDPEIVGDPLYVAMIEDAMLELPTMSIVMDMDDLFGDEGIYAAGGSEENAEWERAASIELFDPMDPSKGGQIDGAIRPHSHIILKRSLKLLFKAEYGQPKLHSCLFADAPANGDTAATKHDRLILRAGTNRSWATQWNPDDTTFTRDQWARDMQLNISGFGSHGTYVHLYINGLYWGIYNPSERTDGWFASEYFGGTKEDWFAINHGGPVHGDSARWDYLTSTLVNSDLTVAANYAEFTSYLQVDQFIDYLALNWYAGTADWPSNNWYAVNQVSPPGPAMFFVWDAEDIWDNEGSSGPFDAPGGRGSDGAWVAPRFVPGTEPGDTEISRLWHAGRRNSDFMMLFADRVYALAFNDGPLTSAGAQALWGTLNDALENAVVAESARWGDSRASLGEPTRTPLISWVPEVERIRDESMPGNPERFVQVLRDNGYYPTLDPPTLSQHGGTVAAGYELVLTNPNGGGVVYYTIDGSDPRQSGGDVAPGALEDAGPITVDAGLSVRARVLQDGEWTALASADFVIQ